MTRLRDLEHRRPSPCGDAQTHRKVQDYRESVIRLSLGVIASTALHGLTIENGIQATRRDEDFESLFRIVMLCQIVDDVIDFATDKIDGLPSFLTAHASPAHAMLLTSNSARRYADLRGLPTSPHLFPFRVALFAVSAVAKIAIGFGRLRLRLQATRNGSVLIVDPLASTDAH